MSAAWCGAAALGVLLSGCESLSDWQHRMHPSQWWKLNRQPAYDDGVFSIPDAAITTDSTQNPEGAEAREDAGRGGE
jgi:hypothetical protein